MKYLFFFLIICLTSQMGNSQTNVLGTIAHQASQRFYLTHLPPNYTDEEMTPVVIFLHGGGGNLQSAQGFTQFNQVADKEGFIVVYPQALFSVGFGSFAWADGRNGAADRAGIDDVGFLDKMIDQLLLEYNIDDRKIYLCGFSNGSFMTQKMAFESNEKLAAIGILGGTLQQSYFEQGNPNRIIPSIFFFGSDDPFVPYDGGVVSGSNTAPVVGIEQAVNFWRTNNQCETSLPPLNLPDIDTTDNSTVTIFEYTTCSCNNAKVKFYQLNGAGHTWPGVELTAQETLLGETNEDIFASQELWDFFKQFSLCTPIMSLVEPIMKQDFFTISPNPTQTTITIKATSPIDLNSISDETGRKIIEAHPNTLFQFQLDMSMLPKGIYFVSVVNALVMNTQKVVLE